LIWQKVKQIKLSFSSLW